MRFKQFITEHKGVFDLEQFKIDCRFALEQSGSGILWHGTPNGPADFEIRTLKFRDSVADTPTRVNKFLENKFGKPIRNWMFTSGSKEQAKIYSNRGAVYMIFPIGEFEWVSGVNKELDDLATWHTKLSMDISLASNGNNSDKINDDLASDFMIRKMQHMKWYHNTNLDKCISNKNEIMIKCNKFYCVNETSPTAKQIKKIL